MNEAKVAFQAYILPIYETELTNVEEKVLDKERNDVTALQCQDHLSLNRL